MLSMAEIMKALSCSRYMVMKYHSECVLPLVKKNNKYFLSEYDLLDWAAQMKKAKTTNHFANYCFCCARVFVYGIISIIE